MHAPTSHAPCLPLRVLQSRGPLNSRGLRILAQRDRLPLPPSPPFPTLSPTTPSRCVRMAEWAITEV